MDIEQIRLAVASMRDRIVAQLGMNDHGLLDKFVEATSHVGPFDSYKIFPLRSRQVADEITAAHGADGLRYFLRATIAHALHNTLASNRLASLPDRVREQQAKQFNRIAADDDCNAPWLDLDHDLFHKEFGIANLRLYVAGAQLVDPRCGIPRSVVIRGTPLDWIRNGSAVLSLGGFRPYFQIHTHKFMLDTFNEEGWEECYRCCAELYDLHPQVLGMYGSSWFYDPALASISPRLGYLREVPQKGGARLLFVEAGGDAIKNSLATSPTRKALYEDGKYLPKSYMLVWGKEKQRMWARSVPESVPIAI